MSFENYDKYYYKLLNDESTYEKINNDPLYDINNKIKKLLDDLLINQNINKKLFNNFLFNENKISKFRILFKLHKKELDSRPIVNKSPYTYITYLFDIILKRFVKETPSQHSRFTRTSTNYKRSKISKRC
jgi:hypothetical protein